MDGRPQNPPPPHPFGKVPKHRKKAQRLRSEQQRRVQNQQDSDIERFDEPESDDMYFDALPGLEPDLEENWQQDMTDDEDEDEDIALHPEIRSPEDLLDDQGFFDEFYFDALEELDPNLVQCRSCQQYGNPDQLEKPCPKCNHRWHFICLARWVSLTGDAPCESCHKYLYQNDMITRDLRKTFLQILWSLKLWFGGVVLFVVFLFVKARPVLQELHTQFSNRRKGDRFTSIFIPTMGTILVVSNLYIFYYMLENIYLLYRAEANVREYTIISNFDGEVNVHGAEHVIVLNPGPNELPAGGATRVRRRERSGGRL